VHTRRQLLILAFILLVRLLHSRVTCGPHVLRSKSPNHMPSSISATHNDAGANSLALAHSRPHSTRSLAHSLTRSLAHSSLTARSKRRGASTGPTPTPPTLHRGSVSIATRGLERALLAPSKGRSAAFKDGSGQRSTAALRERTSRRPPRHPRRRRRRHPSTSPQYLPRRQGRPHSRPAVAPVPLMRGMLLPRRPRLPRRRLPPQCPLLAEGTSAVRIAT